jgi:DedD protein
MSDEGLQEIQLRGKQLVFLAMSATVVAVVIFLCGVMVGRGVPTARQTAAEPIEADALTPVNDPEVPAAATADALEPSGAAPTPLEYPDLVSDQPPAGKPLKPSPAARPFAAENAVAGPETARRVAPAAAPARTTAASAKAADAPAKTSAAANASAVAPAAAPATAGSGGFQVQVAAYQRQGDASTVRERLAKKGYPAFVTSASTAAGTWYRVRVGGYETRDEAQAVAARLKREEQLVPWVTR